MSKENVALFIHGITEKPELNDAVSKAEKTLSDWTEVGAAAGYEFTEDELHSVVGEILDIDDLAPDKTIEAFLFACQSGESELSDEDLDQVAGGLGFAASPNLGRRLSSLGFGGLGSRAETYPPEHIQTGDMPSFDVFRR